MSHRGPTQMLTPPLAVFAWYVGHSLPVTPINPRTASIRLGQKDYSCIPNISMLPEPTDTSLSIITPPGVTMKLLQEAKQCGIPAVWLQPGSFDSEGLEYAKTEFEAAVGGLEGSEGEGWCILVDGEEGLALADRSGERERL